MATEIFERLKPGGDDATTGESPQSKRLWGVHDDSDRDAEEICALVAAEAPLSLPGLGKRKITARRESDKHWEVEIVYSPGKSEDDQDENNKAPGTWTYQFEMGGGTARIYQSLETKRYPPENHAAAARDHYGAIGVNDKNVEGVDIYVPSYAFSATGQVPAALIDGAYKATLFDLAGKVNDAQFVDFRAGEVLFIGASGSKRDATKWEITYRFLASPNVLQLVKLSVPSTGGGSEDYLAGIDKQGWDYVWFEYGVHDATKGLARRPRAAYAEKVYERGDFSRLGIGV